jgi:hypothetical protein
MLLQAVNTAADAENRIHDDQVAAEFGFRGGLVPGVTVYGYLAAAAIEHFGAAWLQHGAMDVRFHQPVYHGDQVQVVAHPETGERVRVEIDGRASGIAWLKHDAAPNPRPPTAKLGSRKIPSPETLAPGTILGTLDLTLDLAGSTICAPVSPIVHGVAQPAVLLVLANEIFIQNYELGPWIHVSSEVRKFQSARDGEPLRVCAMIENLYQRKGHEFVTLLVDIVGPQGPVEYIRHTAIWRPRPI